MFDTLNKILVDRVQLPAEHIDPTATPADIDLDSLAIVELSVALEEDLGIQVGEEELKNAPTIGDIARIVEQRSTAYPA